MQHIKVHHDFDAPAEALWDFLQDFAHIERWWPTHDPAVEIDHVILEGSGIGMVRRIYNKGYAVPVSERLDALDPANRTYTLSIIDDAPCAISFYQAKGSIEDLPGGRCRLNYASQVDTSTGNTDEAEAWLRLAYQLMFRGLSDALARAK